MGEEPDPEGFSVRVSQSLFNSLAGHAADVVSLEPHTPREASLVEAVRKEEHRGRMKLLRRLKEEQLNDARAREDAAKLALKERGKELQEKLNALNFPHGSASDGRRPCESFREAITTCYRANGKENPLACTGEVEAFAECARQLSKISNL